MNKGSIIRYKADYRTLATVGLYGVYLVGSWLAYPLLEWYWIIPMVIIHCFWQFMIATIIHNVIHVTVFRKKWMNQAFQLYLSAIHGHPVSGFVPGHNLSHHEHLQTPKDAARTSRMRFRWNFLNQALFFFHLALEVMGAEQRFVKKMRKVKPVWSRQYLMETIMVFGLKIILLLIDWQRAVFLLVIPNLYATWGIFGTNFWQHDGCDETHPYNHSRTFSGKVFNWLVFNNGYHGVHHMKPGMHWSLYPEYHEKELKPHIHPSLDQKSLFLYLWRVCIYPAVREDYMGNPIKFTKPDKSEDWVEDVSDNPDAKVALGAIQ